MAEAANRDIRNAEEEQRKWRTRWLYAIQATAERRAHWSLVDELYQACHWQNPRPSWRPDPVMNYTFLVTEEHTSQLAQMQADWALEPRRPSDDKLISTMHEVMRFGWQAAEVNSVMQYGDQSSVLKGTGLYHVYWDNNLVGGTPEPIEIYEPMAGGMVGPDGMTPLMRPVLNVPGTLWAGDWRVKHIDPTDFFVDPGLSCPDLQQAIWCGVGDLKPRSWALERWPHLASLNLSAAEVSNLTQAYVRPAVSYNNPEDPYVYVFEGYERLPCDDKHKAAGYERNLRHVVLVNWQLAEVHDYYYQHGLYPFEPQHNYWVPKQFWAIGDPQQFIALERLVRKLYEVFGLNAMLLTGQQYLLNLQSGLSAGNITSEPAKVYGIQNWPVNQPLGNIMEPIKRDFSHAPYVVQFLNMLKDDIQTLTGIFQGLPPGVEAASAVIAVFEKLAARVKKKGELKMQAARGILRQAMGLVAEMYTEERVFRLTQPIDGVPWATFRGTQWRGMEVDIKMNLTPTAPLSKAVVAEQAAAAFAKGAITASEYLEAIDFPKKHILEKVREREERQQALMGGMPGAMGAGGALSPNAIQGANQLPPGMTPANLPQNAREAVLGRLGAAGRV